MGTLGNKTSFNSHIKIYHSKGEKVCAFCNEIFSSPHEYHKHRRIHNKNGETFRKFKNKGPSNLKLKKEDDNLNYKCIYCLNKYNTLNEKDEHIQSIHYIKIYACNTCK